MASGTGLQDWKWQRLTAIILGLYVIYLGVSYLYYAPLTYETWYGLFSHPLLRLWTFLALLSLIIHAWIGLWTVLTDYVKPLWIRYSLQILILAVLVGYFMWGLLLIWGL